jgi:hypothetical protein
VNNSFLDAWWALLLFYRFMHVYGVLDVMPPLFCYVVPVYARAGVFVCVWRCVSGAV